MSEIGEEGFGYQFTDDNSLYMFGKLNFETKWLTPGEGQYDLLPNGLKIQAISFSSVFSFYIDDGYLVVCVKNDVGVYLVVVSVDSITREDMLVLAEKVMNAWDKEKGHNYKAGTLLMPKYTISSNMTSDPLLVGIGLGPYYVKDASYTMEEGISPEGLYSKQVVQIVGSSRFCDQNLRHVSIDESFLSVVVLDGKKDVSIVSVSHVNIPK